ncbi:MAG: class I SAM-dependent methyltransferase [bacterium]
MSTPWNIRLQRTAWYAKSTWAYYRARRLGLVGHEFFRFGRALGWEMYRNNTNLPWDLLVTPVSSTRYYEFNFARECLPADPGVCLDVSSPILFDFYVARNYPSARLHMINPDTRDMDRTRAYMRNLTLPPIHTDVSDVSRMPACPGGYDTIWSLSVVEHIQGETANDSTAVKAMFDALRPGGRLILTVPTDKSFQVEYREKDLYGTQSTAAGQKRETYFFQRVYDEAAIQDRLIRPLGLAPTRIEWYGETTPGRFSEYIRRWQLDGKNTTIWDPLEMARFYRLYDTGSAMPGAGVCGLLFIKP